MSTTGVKETETVPPEGNTATDNPPAAPSKGEVPRVDQQPRVGNQAEYNQWLAQVQEFFKNQPNVQGNLAGGQYFPAHMAPPGYANVWGAQPHAMMTAYGTPQYYAPGMFHHMGMSSPSATHPYGAAYPAPVPPNPPALPSAANEGSATDKPSGENETKEGVPEAASQTALQNAEIWRQRGVNPMMTAQPPQLMAPGSAMIPHDEREVKRQRRKQSNRESARRSRLRKQAECEDLGNKVHTLTRENMLLRNDYKEVHTKFESCIADNKALRNQVIELGGVPPPEPDYKASKLDKETLDKLLQPVEYQKIPENGHDSEHEHDSFSGSEDEHDKMPRVTSKEDLLMIEAKEGNHPEAEKEADPVK